MTLTPYDKLNERAKLEAERFAKIHKIAIEQRLMLVKISQRKYILIECSLDTSAYGAIESVYRANLSGQIVCGPTSYKECQQYILDHGKDIPFELTQPEPYGNY